MDTGRIHQEALSELDSLAREAELLRQIVECNAELARLRAGRAPNVIDWNPASVPKPTASNGGNAAPLTLVAPPPADDPAAPDAEPAEPPDEPKVEEPVVNAPVPRGAPGQHHKGTVIDKVSGQKIGYLAKVTLDSLRALGPDQLSQGIADHGAINRKSVTDRLRDLRIAGLVSSRPAGQGGRTQLWTATPFGKEAEPLRDAGGRARPDHLASGPAPPPELEDYAKGVDDPVPPRNVIVPTPEGFEDLRKGELREPGTLEGRILGALQGEPMTTQALSRLLDENPGMVFLTVKHLMAEGEVETRFGKLYAAHA